MNKAAGARKHRRCKSWAAVAGFFDGDGSAEERVGRYVVGCVLGFTDNWPEQLKAVRRFLISEGISLGVLTKRLWKGKNSAWQLRICNIEGVLRAAKTMLPHCVKKEAELRAIVQYLEDQITGDELVRVVNHGVDIGSEAGKPGACRLPMVRSEGNRLRRQHSLRLAHAAIDTKVNEQDAIAIRRLYRTGEYSMRELADRHGLGRWAIGRILGKSYRSNNTRTVRFHL